MKKELVSFKTAKLAKEKGFDLVTQAYYNDNKIKYFLNKAHDNCKNSRLYDNFYSAPTQSLLQGWLREEYDIHIGLTINPFSDDELYGFKIYMNNNTMRCVLSEELDISYEEALEIALYESLKLIK